MKISAKFARSSRHRQENGVTMLLIAVGLSFMILAMAALAIDLVSIYGAHNDARMAADAAALAGAEAIANSGFTTDQTTIPWTTIQPIAQNAAVVAATQNKIAGQAISLASVNVTYGNYAVNTGTNPQVTVTVTDSGLPAFFSRIWGNKNLTVAASATAEVYNPSGNTLPVQPQCVKPWLLPNLDLLGGANHLFDPATGLITPGLDPVGQVYPLTLNSKCNGTGCAFPITTATQIGGVYIPAQMDAPVVGATCATDSSCAYEQDIAACSPQPVSCSSSPSLQQVAVDGVGCGLDHNTMTNTGTSCLIHGTALGSGQDCMGIDSGSCAASSAPLMATQMFAGANNRLIANGVNILTLGSVISTSDSLVTIPVYDNVGPILAPGNVNVIGFVQGFITQVDGSGKITIQLVNIAGCGSGVSGSPVQGDSISPIPVHLIR